MCSFSFAFLEPKDDSKYLQSTINNVNMIVYPETFKPHLKDFVKAWVQIDKVYAKNLVIVHEIYKSRLSLIIFRFLTLWHGLMRFFIFEYASINRYFEYG